MRLKRRAIARTALIIAAGLLSAAGVAPLDGRERPNIVWIMADDLGWGELGCYGQGIIETPHIDRLAREGMRFMQFYSGAPVCAPARCVLMTGRHSGRAFIRTNREVKPEGQAPIPDETVTVAELLQDAGYKTGAMGKWGLGMFGTSGDPNRQGFDLFYGFNCQRHAHNHYPRYLWRNDRREELEGNDRTLTGEQHSQDLFVREALRFIRRHQAEPFFLYLPFAIPHLSIQTTDQWLDKYESKITEAKYKHSGYLKHPAPRAGYAAMVTQMDHGVGEVMRLLKELKLDDDTVVFFTSDNGPTFDRLGGSDSDFFKSAGPLRGRKGAVYEGGIRVPLVARWPGRIEAGATTDQLGAFWDVLPTLCELANVKPAAKIDGVSLAPTLLGEGRQQQHDYLYWEFPSYGGQQALRRGDWKAVRRGMFAGDYKTELYNLAEDIGEARDVAGRHVETVAELERLMQQARTPSKEFPFPALDKR